MSKPITIAEYINTAPKEAQQKLQELYTLLKSIVPDAEEAIKWGAPCFVEKRILFAFKAHKAHINFIPTHASLIPFQNELADYTIGKDTVQLPYTKPLPLDLIRLIAEHRCKDVRENDAMWIS